MNTPSVPVAAPLNNISEALVNAPSIPVAAPLNVIIEDSVSSRPAPLSPIELGKAHFMWALNQAFEFPTEGMNNEALNLLSAIPNSTIGSRDAEHEPASGQVPVTHSGATSPVQVGNWLEGHTDYREAYSTDSGPPSEWLGPTPLNASRNTSTAGSPLEPVPAHNPVATTETAAIPLPSASGIHMSNPPSPGGNLVSDNTRAQIAAGLPTIAVRRATLTPLEIASRRSNHSSERRQAGGLRPNYAPMTPVPVSPFLKRPPFSPLLDGPPIALPGTSSETGQGAPSTSNQPRDRVTASRAPTSIGKVRFTDSLPEVQLLTTTFRKIGTGSFSDVYATTALLDGKQTECAIKTFKPDYQDVGQEEAEIQVRLLNEMNGYSPYIVKYYGCMRTTGTNGELVTAKPDAAGGIISVAMEFVKGPSADHVINAVRALARGNELSYEDVMIFTKKLMHDALRGAVEFQKNGLAHNDYKANNLIYSEEEKIFKTMDVSNASAWLEEKPMGHPFYTPPERSGCMATQGLRNASGPKKRTKLKDSEKVLINQLPDFLSKFGDFYKPPHSSSDSYALAQIGRNAALDGYFLPIDPDRLASLKGTISSDDQGLQFAAMVGWNLRKIDRIYDLEKEQNHEGYAEKQKHHFFEFIEDGMRPDFKNRSTPEELLKHPFITENYPSPETWERLYDKLAGAIVAIHKAADNAQSNRQANVQRLSSNAPNIDRPSQSTGLNAPEVAATSNKGTTSDYATTSSGESLFQVPKTAGTSNPNKVPANTSNDET